MKDREGIIKALPTPFSLEGHPAFCQHVIPSENKDLVFLYLDLLPHLTLNEALLISVIFHNKDGAYKEDHWQSKFHDWCSRSTFKRTVNSINDKDLISQLLTKGNYSLTLKEDVLIKFCADAGLKRGKGKLLLAGKFIAINKVLVKTYGLHGAIILEQVHRWHNYLLSSERDLSKSKYFLYGHPWLRRSVSNIQKMDLPFIGLTALKQHMKSISTSDPEKFTQFPLLQVKFGNCRNVSHWSINYDLLLKALEPQSSGENPASLISMLFLESRDAESKKRIAYLLAFCSRKGNESHSDQVLYDEGLIGVRYFEKVVEVLVWEFSKSSQGNLKKILITRYRKMGISLLLMDLIRVVSSFYIKSGGRYIPISLKENELIRSSRYPKEDSKELIDFIRDVQGVKNLLNSYLHYLLEHADKVKRVGHIRMAWRQYAEDCL
ncbi:hypothetical protein LNTAR_14967 [Lentisphaera araneosa HTCC2155]|uniref:Uncharacterized protein n=1 Tax=Lentisphaera araneosa HTCC2155 TaxID=313628 RepID=A6DHP5_9BACT|nr:hypothetical protein [Lentisphaera araneosa]EDM29128.1 hypothetical protein LNTAR_14967 [Lentisphaera araneosa HTCC2155]